METDAARGINTPMEWLELPPFAEDTRRIRHTDVSQDPRYPIPGSSASDGDMKYTEVSTRMPPWVLPAEETQNALRGIHGTALDLIYARGVLATPILDRNNVNKKFCPLILVEVEFCRDLGCDNKLTEKPEKYSSLIAAL